MNCESEFMDKDNNMHMVILTRIRAHPVGMKAKIAANISLKARPTTTNNTVMTDTNPRNKSAFRILNIS